MAWDVKCGVESCHPPVFLQKSVHHLIGSSRAHDRENHHTLQHFYQHRNFLCDVNSLLRILEMFANCVRSPTVYTSHGRRRPTKIKLLFGCLIPFVYLKRTILQGPLQNPKQNANASAASQRRRRRAVPGFRLLTLSVSALRLRSLHAAGRRAARRRRFCTIFHSLRQRPASRSQITPRPNIPAIPLIRCYELLRRGNKTFAEPSHLPALQTKLWTVHF